MNKNLLTLILVGLAGCKSTPVLPSSIPDEMPVGVGPFEFGESYESVMEKCEPGSECSNNFEFRFIRNRLHSVAWKINNDDYARLSRIAKRRICGPGNSQCDSVHPNFRLDLGLNISTEYREMFVISVPRGKSIATGNWTILGPCAESQPAILASVDARSL
jgi:hypothetical protein